MELKLTRFPLKKFILKNIFHRIIFFKNPFILVFLWFKGFDSDSILSYNLNLKNYHLYLPDGVKYRITLSTNSGYWPIMHDKLIFYNYINHKLPTPELDFIIYEGQLIPVEDKSNDLNRIIQSGFEYVLKPLQGGEGQGISFIKEENGIRYFKNNPLIRSELVSFVSGCNFYGIFRYYRQHSLLNKIFSGTTNTIRMITLKDVETKSPFIFNSSLRIGWSGSAPLDNFTRGGLVAQIDNETGVVSKWKRKRVVSGLVNIEEGREHPDTQEVIEGIVIPHWEEVKNKILQFMSDNPFLDFIGWDILITEDSFVVIEANHNPGLYTVQLFKPYLSDSRAYNFFKSKKII